MNTKVPQSVISEEDQRAFNDLAVAFAKNQLAGFIHDHEYPYRLDPAGIINSVNDLGFLSINLPSAYGGLGLGVQPLSEILEQISLVDAGLAGTLFSNNAALEIISVASHSSNCDRIYETISRANVLPLAFQAYSSPAETSAPASVKSGGAHNLHGKAELLVSGGSAAYAVIPGKDDAGAYSYFLVNLGDKEIKKSGPVVTIGMQSCRPVDIELDGAAGVLIGEEGKGTRLFDEVCRRMSYPACGILLGIMKGSFDTAFEYCGQRYQGGRMIIQWSDVQMKLAGAATLMRLAEACVHGLKSMFAAGTANAGHCAVAAAIHIGNMAADVTSEGVQLLGGNGYMKDYGQEKRMRDAKQAQSLLGSSPLRKKGLIDAVIKERLDA